MVGMNALRLEWDEASLVVFKDKSFARFKWDKNQDKKSINIESFALNGSGLDDLILTLQKIRGQIADEKATKNPEQR